MDGPAQPFLVVLLGKPLNARPRPLPAGLAAGACELLVPFLNLAQELNRAAPLHGVVRLRRPALLGGRVLLVIDIIDDWPDHIRVEHWVFNQKEHRGAPEGFVGKTAPQFRGYYGLRQCLAASLSHHLRPAQGLGRRQVAWCLGKDVRHALGEHKRQIGRAEVLPAAHVDKPPLLALGLWPPAAEPPRIQAGRHLVAGQ